MTGADSARAPTEREGGRLIALDAFRFFAACCVVVYHYNQNFELGLQRWSAAPEHFYVMVDFFFILSGFVIALSYSERLGSLAGLRAYFVSRFARLYPLHVLTILFLLAFIAFGALVGFKSNDPDNWALKHLPAQLLLVQAWGFSDRLYFNGPSWSISAEWFAYLLAPALFFVSRRVGLVVGLAISVAGVVAFIAFRKYLGLTIPWTDATFDYGAFRALPEFFCGAVLARAYQTNALSFRPRWWMIHALLVAVMVSLHLGWPDEIAVALFVALVIGAALAEKSGQRSALMSPTAARLGDASYAVYMIHMPLIIPMAFFLRRAHLMGTPAAWGVVAVFFAALIALSIATHRYFEGPMRRIIRDALSPRRPRATPDQSSPNRNAG